MHAEKIQHSLDMFVSVEYCIIIRVHSVFSLVENRDCRLTMFQRQTNFSIDRDHVKWRAKIFSSDVNQMFRCKFCISYVKYEFLFCF